MPIEEEFQRALEELRKAGLLREARTIEPLERARARIDGREVVLFCSNDYLGLSDDPRLRELAVEAFHRHGIGAGASRLITGTRPAHRTVERKLAEWVGLTDALLFSSGYAANVGALSTVLATGDVAFSDELNHASLIDGLRLSRAQVHVYPHADVDALERLLATHRTDAPRAFIVTDALFSMDGDRAPLSALSRLARSHDAGLFVDEAHALGTLGEGRGLCYETSVRPDVLVGTLGKAVGVAGAFVAGSEALRACLENRARSYVFSTAVPAAVAELIAHAATRARGADLERTRLARHSARIRDALGTLGFDVPAGDSPIIPVRISDPARTMELSAALLSQGYFVHGIRPPTVPNGTSRLRVVPTAAHSDEQVEGLIEAFGALA